MSLPQYYVFSALKNLIGFDSYQLAFDELKKKAEEMGLGKTRLQKIALTELIIDVETGRIDRTDPSWEHTMRCLYGNWAFEEEQTSNFVDNIPDSEKEEFLRTREDCVLVGQFGANKRELHYALLKLQEIQKSVDDLCSFLLRKVSI